MSPGRTLWEPCTVPGDIGRGGVVPVSASGVTLQYSDGSTRTCMNSGLWNVPFGYGDKELIESLHTASVSASYLQQPNSWAVEAADAVAEALGGDFTNVLFSTSGGAAVDTTMKLCRLYGSAVGGPRKRVVIGLTESYHGLLYGSYGLTGEEVEQERYSLDRRFIHHIAMNDEAGLDRLLDEHGASICGMFIEPVQGNNGEAMTAAFVQRITAAARKYDFLVVADEVTTGVYRTGPFTASSAWAVPPDVVILSKGLTNGLVAASAIAVGPRAVDALRSRRLRLIHLETQAGTPMSCAAMISALSLGKRMHESGVIHRAGRDVQEVLAEVAASVGSLRAHGTGSLRFLTPIESQGRLADAGPGAIVEDLYHAGVVGHQTLRGLAIVPAFVSTPSDLDILKTALIKVLA
jgi:beta-alanine--pyruvate transaminase